MANSGAPLRVAFTGSDAAPFVNLAVRPRKETEYEGDRYESLLRTLGVKVGSARLRWNIARSSEKDVEALLIQFGLRIDRPLIGIDVSPSVYDKGFPPELLKGLIDTLVAEDRAEIILFYSREQDREQMKSFSFLNRAIVPIPEDKISFATAFINKCSLIIALNNLVYQLGIMLGRPTVGLFENAESRQWICVAPGKFESVCAPRLKNLSLEEILSRVKSLMPLQA
ncbi:hypothetical protein A2274_02615 [candidate division WWE3 bacterium RIFOXYA12_FULL_43_11]|nr:MAG: hypothetical protein A2274_02615 [candidate division WWE3 bacterium RIFOXYA12_FULL_43_11]